MGATMPVEQEETQEGLTWYVTFISIVFGVFISVWVQPLEGEGIRGAFPPTSLSDALLLARAILMFVILVCLWWWYAIFLGKVNPAKGFPMYIYEFTTLAVFAIGFRYWDHAYLFPWAVFIGSALMLGRFYLALGKVGGIPHNLSDIGAQSKEWWALIIALVTLVMYVAVILGALTVIFLSPGISQEQQLNSVHYVVTFLLLVGFLATMLAVNKAEGGFKWGKPEVIVGLHREGAQPTSPIRERDTSIRRDPGG